MIKIDLKLEFCNKEQELLELIGKDSVMEMYLSAKSANNLCACCSYVPKNNQTLKLHVLKINKEIPQKSHIALLCEACYYHKHINKAIEEENIILANSQYSQIDLIKIQRESNRRTNYEVKKKRIVILKMTPSEYFTPLKDTPEAISPFMKLVFNKKFNWKKNSK